MDLKQIYGLFVKQGRDSLSGKQVALFVGEEEYFSGYLHPADISPDKFLEYQPDALWQVVSTSYGRIHFMSSHVVKIEPRALGESREHRITLTHIDDPLLDDSEERSNAYREAKRKFKAAMDDWATRDYQEPDPITF